MNDSNKNGVHLGFVVEVVEGDAINYPTGVLAVKHAPSSHGLGALVRTYLTGDEDILPTGDEYRIWSGRGISQAEYILMVGAPPIFSLRYQELRDLMRRFFEALWTEGVDVRHMTTTVHGIDTTAGLDEIEAFRSLLLGAADACESGHYPPMLERVTFIEKDPRQVEVLTEALEEFLGHDAPPPPVDASRPEPAAQAVMAGPESFEPQYRGAEPDDLTSHVFVAMPFKDDYDDQFYLAILPTVRESGLLCERMDLDTFTGDIVERMLARIRCSRLVIALLDGANPNVYLEVGYAWGVGTPVLLLAHEGETLPFDVRGQRILIYNRIYRLKERLVEELARLLDT